MPNKYAHRYLAETQYPFNRRFETKAILPRLIKAAATTGAWTDSRVRVAEIQCQTRASSPKTRWP